MEHDRHLETRLPIYIYISIWFSKRRMFIVYKSSMTLYNPVMNITLKSSKEIFISNIYYNIIFKKYHIIFFKI